MAAARKSYDCRLLEKCDFLFQIYVIGDENSIFFTCFTTGKFLVNILPSIAAPLTLKD